jgi:hypothetical protein
MTTLTTSIHTEPDPPNPDMEFSSLRIGEIELFTDRHAADGTLLIGECEALSWSPDNLAGLRQLRDLVLLIESPTGRAAIRDLLATLE